MKRSKLIQLRALIEKAAASLPDEDALEAVELFPAWAADTAYAQGSTSLADFISQTKGWTLAT